MSKIISAFFFGMSLMSFVGAFITNSIRNENAELRAMLDDPHRCLSICVEEWAKWGC